MVIRILSKWSYEKALNRPFSNVHASFTPLAEKLVDVYQASTDRNLDEQAEQAAARVEKLSKALVLLEERISE